MPFPLSYGKIMLLIDGGVVAYWLVKSEPQVYPIDQLARDRSTDWDGVRNYQARNNLKSMRKGDSILFYHSSADIVGVAGLAVVGKEAFADPTQFDSASEYFDEKATLENPRWYCPRFNFVEKFKNILPLELLREQPQLKKMALLQRGSRLSVQPVSDAEYKLITKLAGAKN